MKNKLNISLEKCSYLKKGMTDLQKLLLDANVPDNNKNIINKKIEQLIQETNELTEEIRAIKINSII